MKKNKNISIGDLIIPTDEYLLERKRTLNIEESLGCVGIVVDVSEKGNWIKAYFGLGKHFEILRADEVDIVLNMNNDKEKNQDVPT
tara:strand:+ start:359 stop:616 length:258 start_codon:yes stop_codon:yes gene_type:complete